MKSNKLNVNYKEGLEPWVDNNSQILILGTMPGDESLEKQSYYCNSRNAFWKLMENIFPRKGDENHLSNKQYILSRKIALWDCLKCGERKGSSDSAFSKSTLIPNDLEQFLKQYPSIKTIVLNGNTAEEYFCRYFPNIVVADYSIIKLISTSGAAARPFFEKRAEWSKIKDYIK